MVASAFRRAFAAGLAGESSPGSVCGGDERVLSSAVSEPVIDVAGGTPSCGKSKLLCLGKADDADHPFFDHEHDDLGDDEATAGCSTGGADGGALLVIAGLLIARRRRAVR